ncbi:hypothetical protein BBJ28_00020697, partial [Nothophytophthora sp. Chile5]
MNIGGLYGATTLPRSPPSESEMRLMDVLLQAPDARVATLLTCLKGWPFEAQADLANWRRVLTKLHTLLLDALRQCPRLVAIPVDGDMTIPTEEGTTGTLERESTEQVFEILRFSAMLLENAANKAVYPSAEVAMTLLGARNDRLVFEATRVVAALSLPPQVHR